MITMQLIYGAQCKGGADPWTSAERENSRRAAQALRANEILEGVGRGIGILANCRARNKFEVIASRSGVLLDYEGIGSPKDSEY